MNDYERNQWVDNDEGLYNWWHRSGLSKSAFIREHRVAIDKVIGNVTTSRRPAHYLAYPERYVPRMGGSGSVRAPSYGRDYGMNRTRGRGRTGSRWGQPLSRNEKIAVGVLAVVGGVVVVKSVAG
jgi:hypothetical protein